MQAFDGASRSPAVQATALVVSQDGEIRNDWARQLEDQGFRTIRCAGPIVGCALESRRTCPLLDEASVAIYDERILTGELVSALLARPFVTRILVARDRMRSDGRHEPMIVRPNAAIVPLRWAMAAEARARG